MKNFKKFMDVLICIVTAASVFIGCASGTSESGATSDAQLPLR